MTLPSSREPSVPLILASQSERRHRILAGLGFRFEIIVSDLEEILDPTSDPESNARALASQKARRVAESRSRGVVLGADTLVALGDEILGKPRDDAHAREILRRLSGTRHRVITGVCVVDAGTGEEVVDSAVAHLEMSVMEEKEIAAYVASGASEGKAGAYGYQVGGDRFLTLESGDVDTVVGLPGRLTVSILARFGILPGGSGSDRSGG